MREQISKKNNMKNKFENVRSVVWFDSLAVDYSSSTILTEFNCLFSFNIYSVCVISVCVISDIGISNILIHWMKVAILVRHYNLFYNMWSLNVCKKLTLYRNILQSFCFTIFYTALVSINCWCCYCIVWYK